jgi:dienelactone hydrolase
MTSRSLKYQADSLSMDAELFYEPADSKRPGVLVFPEAFGLNDPLIPPAQRTAFEDEMRAGKVDWQMTLYGGAVHSFTSPRADLAGQPQMIRYDAKADARSWQQMRALFDEVF